MKKSLMFLSAAVLALSTVFISSCGDDDEGGAKEIPAALIKTLTIDYDNGDYVEMYEFTYDAANNNRLVSAEVTETCCDPYTITYDYSVAGQLTVDGTVYILDSEGRIIKELWTASTDDNFDGYEYDEDGYMIRKFYKEDGVEYDYEEATVVDGNITVHSRFDGDDLERTKNFTYLPSATAKNVSNLPQANLINSERKSVSGLYGRGSKKLVQYLELNYVGFPEDYVKNSNTYVFDEITNQVVSIQRTGTDADGNDTGLDELFTYTYYPIEE